MVVRPAAGGNDVTHFTLQSDPVLTHPITPEQLSLDISNANGTLTGTLSGIYSFPMTGAPGYIVQLIVVPHPPQWPTVQGDSDNSLSGTMNDDGSMAGVFNASFLIDVFSDAYGPCHVTGAAWTAAPLAK